MEILELQDLANHLTPRFRSIFSGREQVCINREFNLIACKWDGSSSVRLFSSDFKDLNLEKLIINKDGIFYKVLIYESDLNLAPL